LNIRLKPNGFEAVNGGRKFHRYKRKIVFEIVGVVYNCTMSNNQATLFKKETKTKRTNASKKRLSKGNYYFS